jgi:hypothetical protein
VINKVKFMKRILYPVMIGLFLCANFVAAQDNLSVVCRSLKKDLSDSEKFEEAVRCKHNPKIVEGREPVNLTNLPQPVRIASLASSCGDFKIKNNNWVTILDEMKIFYANHLDEFEGGGLSIQNRLEKLIGVKVNEYNCLVVYEVPKDLLRRTNKGDDDPLFPFTNNGFTCDWFYPGIGCSSGLSEFIANGADNNRRPVIRYEFRKQAKLIYQCLKGDEQSPCTKKSIK